MSKTSNNLKRGLLILCAPLILWGGGLIALFSLALFASGFFEEANTARDFIWFILLFEAWVMPILMAVSVVLGIYLLVFKSAIDKISQKGLDRYAVTASLFMPFLLVIGAVFSERITIDDLFIWGPLLYSIVVIPTAFGLREIRKLI